MKLRSIELYGFKSFADKTKLVFEKDISAIVGPNGSGKSNISDAIRWVLGEQSAKTLRGNKMEDVIFSGTDDKKQMNLAQVTLNLDNSDKSLPLAFDEVSVTRRVYRTGESEYLINNSQVRLKDIKELFLDTGVGKDGYSIIGQGRIDDILNGKSEDRRYIFEEACGISKNKYKKAEAERKLIKNEENLNSLKSELKVKEQETALLEKQAQNAKEGMKLSGQLEKFELSLLNQGLEKIDVDLEKNKANLSYININLEEESKKLSYLSNLIAPLQEELEILEKEYNLKKDRIILNEKESLDSENKLNLLKEQVKFYQLDIDRISGDILSRSQKYNQNTEKISGFEDKIKELETSKVEIQEQISRLKEENIDKKKLIGEMETLLDNKQEELKKLNVRLSGLKVDQGTKIQLDISNNRLKETYLKEISRLEDLLLSLDKRKEDAKGELALTNEEILKTTAFIEGLVEDRNLLNINISSLEKELRELQNDFYKRESKRDVLDRLYRSYEGFNKPIQNLLRDAGKNDLISKRIVGVLADLIEIDSKYRTALDVTLSSSLQNIVVNDENDAKFLIDYLKKNSYGRVTFLPINKIKGKQYPVKNPKVIDSLNNLVKYDGRIGGIIDHFLSRTLLVENMDHAIEVSRELGNYRIVTLDGEIINSWGSMVGGNIYKKESSSIINRKKELDLLNAQLASDKKLIEAKKEDFESSKSSLEGILYKLNDLDGKNAKFLRNRADISSNLKEIDLERALNEKSLLEYRDLLEKTNERLAEKDYSHIGDLEKEQKDLERYIEDLSKDYQVYKDEISDLDKELYMLSSKLEVLIRDIGLNIDGIENLKFENANMMDSNKNDELNLNILKADINKANLNIQKNNDACNMLSDENIRLSKEIQELEYKKKLQKDKMASDSAKIDSLKESIGNFEKEKFKLDLSIESSQAKKNELYQTYMDNYSVEFEDLLDKLSKNDNIKVSKKEIAEIKARLSQIGYFNYESIEAYNIAFEELSFMKKQFEDLLSSKNDIIAMIKSIEKDMVDMFKSSFVKINERFSGIFSILFDGGEASLLLDGDDVLTAGIEIIAKPPGKKLKNLGLLSGGEKALAAVALLFAIFEINPAPFCILDEIDAALDEANISRYFTYLKSMINQTQFIMITHRKVTMEMADILYGVTMEEKGISKVITLALDKFRRTNV